MNDVAETSAISAPSMAGALIAILCRTPPFFAAAGAWWTFGDKGGQMFELSEFLSARQTPAGRRDRAAGQAMG